MESVAEYAKTKPPGVHKLQLRPYPPVFADITVNGDRVVSMHVTTAEEDDLYPKDIIEACRLGYQWHCDATPEANERCSFKLFKKLHESVCNKIDKSIATHHGITCCIDSNSELNHNDAFILHFVDVLSIHLAKKHEKPAPQVIIKTSSFDAVHPNMVCSIFDTRMGCEHCFTNQEKEFVLKNPSIFYFIYGYWHNYSNKSIRCSFQEIEEIGQAHILANDNIFARLQVAKHDQLSRRAQGNACRKLYLVD